jgi:CubicO group peptidase (beta-lactamase class C family)
MIVRHGRRFCWRGAVGLYFVLLANTGAEPQPVRELVEPYLARKQIPGCAIMVRRGGETILCGGYGFANVEHNVPATAQTLFQSGSIGKQFTAMAVMLLVEEGKLSLDAPLPNAAVPDRWSHIRLRHLLTHTSGLGDYPESLDLRKDYSEEELWKMVTEQPLNFKAGDKMSYSNLGYVLLGIVVHKVSGFTYSDFLRERIFEPLEMRNSRVISEKDIIPRRAAGYRLNDGELTNQDWVSPSLNTTADGSLYLTAEDMAKWHAALDNRRLLAASSYAAIWSPAKLNDGSTAPYGFGWGIGKTHSGHRVLEHGGAWQGFAAYTARYPDDDLSVAVFCNRAGAPARYLAQRMAGLFIPELGPERHVAVTVATDVLKGYAGRYRMEDRFTITVEAVADHLETKWLGERITMTPESETRFFELESDRTFRFAKNAKDEVAELKIFVPEELTLRRLPDAR